VNVDHLVKMANEIAAFFAGASPPEQAPRDIATHLKRYWEPRMRQAMLSHFARGGAGLTDPARSAVAILAAEAGGASRGGGPGAAGAPGGADTSSASVAAGGPADPAARPGA